MRGTGPADAAAAAPDPFPDWAADGPAAREARDTIAITVAVVSKEVITARFMLNIPL
jgi:hypothetical protein